MFFEEINVLMILKYCIFKSLKTASLLSEKNSSQNEYVHGTAVGMYVHIFISMQIPVFLWPDETMIYFDDLLCAKLVNRIYGTNYVQKPNLNKPNSCPHLFH